MNKHSLGGVFHRKCQRADIWLFLPDSVQNQGACVGGKLHVLRSQPQAPGPRSRGTLFEFLNGTVEIEPAHKLLHRFKEYSV